MLRAGPRNVETYHSTATCCSTVVVCALLYHYHSVLASQHVRCRWARRYDRRAIRLYATGVRRENARILLNLTHTMQGVTTDDVPNLEFSVGASYEHSCRFSCQCGRQYNANILLAEFVVFLTVPLFSESGQR